jgi:aspartate/methionine/tyrosine aminotransferase
LLISSSKVFSYAGQRLGIIAVSDKLMKREFEDLKPFFGNKRFGHCLVFGALYALTSGTAHSAQYAVAEILKAANNGNFKFLDEVKTYGAKAHRMKQLMTENNFYVVYDKDIDKQLADGFYFTFAYPGFSGAGLVAELLYYGISAISLDITGSEKKEGVRACTSQIQDSQFADLELRLKKFAEDHPLN